MFLLTSGSLLPSARSLRDEIDRLCGERLRIKTQYPELGTIAIRWGNSAYQTGKVKDLNLNSPALVRVFANKKLFSDKFDKYFWVPKFRRDTPQQSDFPLLIRETMTSFGGRGIICCGTRADFVHNWANIGYWTNYIDLSTEFRVHVFDGAILRIFKKVKSPYVEEDQTGFSIRNSMRGWHFSPVSSDESFPTLAKLVIDFWNKTAEIFNIQHAFFALDVGWNKEKRRYFVLEGNTAPGIANNEHTRNKYAEKFIDVLKL